jgi:hypothetical protein
LTSGGPRIFPKNERGLSLLQIQRIAENRRQVRRRQLLEAGQVEEPREDLGRGLRGRRRPPRDPPPGAAPGLPQTRRHRRLRRHGAPRPQQVQTLQSRFCPSRHRHVFDPSGVLRVLRPHLLVLLPALGPRAEVGEYPAHYPLSNARFQTGHEEHVRHAHARGGHALGVSRQQPHLRHLREHGQIQQVGPVHAQRQEVHLTLPPFGTPRKRTGRHFEKGGVRQSPVQSGGPHLHLSQLPDLVEYVTNYTLPRLIICFRVGGGGQPLHQETTRRRGGQLHSGLREGGEEAGEHHRRDLQQQRQRGESPRALQAVCGFCLEGGVIACYDTLQKVQIVFILFIYNALTSHSTKC